LLISWFLPLILSSHGHALQSDERLLKVVSFHAPAESASRLLKDLSSAAEIQLSVSKELERDVLVVDVDGVKLGTLMSKIGFATDARWTNSGDGYELVQTLSDRKQAGERSAAERTVEIEQAQETLKKNLPPSDGSQLPRTAAKVRELAGLLRSGDHQKAMNLSMSVLTDLPLSRAAAEILATAPPGDLARLEAGRRFVYCSNPNELQLPVPNAISKIVDTGIDQFNQLLSMSPLQSGSFHSPTDNLPKMVVYVPFLAPFEKSVVIGKDWKYYLVLNRFMRCGRDRMIIGLTLQVVSPDGKILTSGFASLRAPDKPAPSGQSDSVALGRSAATMAAITDSYASGTVFSKPPLGEDDPGVEELRLAFFSPQGLEPLSLIPGEPLSNYAQSHQRALVASLPDASMFACTLPPSKEPSLSNLLFRLKDEGAADTIDADGWIVCRPQDPQYSREIHTDRDGLKRLIVVANAKGCIPQRDMEAFAEQDSPGLSLAPAKEFQRIVLFAAVRDGARGFEQEPTLLRFLAALDSTSREALQAGNKVTVGLDAEDVRLSLAYLLASGSAAPMPKRDVAAMSWEQSIFTVEPTEFLEARIPAIVVQRSIMSRVRLVAILRPNGFPKIQDMFLLSVSNPDAKLQAILETVGPLTVSFPGMSSIDIYQASYEVAGIPVRQVGQLPTEWIPVRHQ
jgi:hypothetical protein